MVIKQNGKIPKTLRNSVVGHPDSIKVGGVRACVRLYHALRTLPASPAAGYIWVKASRAKGGLVLSPVLGTGESRPGIESAVYSRLALCVSGLLVCVDVPYHVVGQTPDPVPCALRHLRESFCFCLVLKGIAWEVDSCV